MRAGAFPVALNIALSATWADLSDRVAGIWDAGRSHSACAWAAILEDAEDPQAQALSDVVLRLAPDSEPPRDAALVLDLAFDARGRPGEIAASGPAAAMWSAEYEDFLAILHGITNAPQSTPGAVFGWCVEGRVAEGLVDVVAGLRAAAAARPEAVALCQDGVHETYGALLRRAEGIAAELAMRGLGPESLVAVALPRSPNWVAAVLGIALSGAAALFLDAGDPPGRLADLARRARVDLAIAEDPAVFAGIAPGLDPAALRAPLSPSPADAAADLPAERLGYVICTSGSSGPPKAVEVGAGALANLVAWHRRVHAPGPGTRCAHLAGLGFDAAVWELWPPLVAGACLCLGPAQPPTDPLAWLARAAVQQAFLATPLVELALSGSTPVPRGLERLLTGGAALTARPGPGLALFNHYGPTEAGVVASFGSVAPAPGTGAPAPGIGGPIDGARLVVRDTEERPAAPGAAASCGSAAPGSHAAIAGRRV